MTESAEFITENEVVEAVAGYLSNNGWEIVATCTTAQRGVDILAKRNGETLAVEAKGAGSATPESRRYGKPFTNNQNAHTSHPRSWPRRESSAERSFGQRLHFPLTRCTSCWWKRSPLL